MAREKIKREPLLYIHQPVFQAPKIAMQDTYSAKKEEQRKIDLIGKATKAAKAAIDTKETEETVEETKETKETNQLIEAELREIKEEKKRTKVFEKELGEETGIFSRTPKPELSVAEIQGTIAKYNEDRNNRETTDSATQENNRRRPVRRLKTFREMDTQERLEYLSQFPKQLPPVPCIFQTKALNYRGLLSEKNDEQIVIKQFDKDKTKVTLAIKDIVNVRMIGLG